VPIYRNSTARCYRFRSISHGRRDVPCATHKSCDTSCTRNIKLRRRSIHVDVTHDTRSHAHARRPDDDTSGMSLLSKSRSNLAMLALSSRFGWLLETLLPCFCINQPAARPCSTIYGTVKIEGECMHILYVPVWAHHAAHFSSMLSRRLTATLEYVCQGPQAGSSCLLRWALLA
jgi:hypothetical protein